MPLMNATGYWTVGDYGSTPNYSASILEDEEISYSDRRILRSLAERVAIIAGEEIQTEKRDLWFKHNSLIKTRPLIICDPENGWNEIIKTDMLKCKSRLAKHWEMVLRKEIFWGTELKDDKPIEAKFDIGYMFTESDWGIKENFFGGVNGGSYTWQPGLKEYKDFEKLHFPKIEIDFQKTEFSKALAKDIFGDLLEVRIIGKWWWSTGLTYDLVLLRGMEQVMIDMIEAPNFVHSIMEFLKEGTLSKIRYLESNNLLSLNNDLYLSPGGFGYTDELPKYDFKGKVRTIDIWGYSESQETIGISPQMFKEFIFPYQVQIQKQFGLNSYGCCEPLNKRWEIIKEIPRLRKVSVSPWANLNEMANNLENRYCYCLKPSPVLLAIRHIDEKKIRNDLKEAFKISKDCIVEVLMQDNHTIGNNPQNVIQWVKIALEEAERIG